MTMISWVGEGDGADWRAIRIGPRTSGLAILTATACALNVVESIGQPCPVPLRFSSVTIAALMRASWDAVELSWGKEKGMDELFRTWPAATFAFRIWICSCLGENYAETDAKDGVLHVCPYLDEGHTVWRAGARDLDGLTVGPVHGAITITGACIDPSVTKNDSRGYRNVPVGLTPAEKPN